MTGPRPTAVAIVTSCAAALFALAGCEQLATGEYGSGERRTVRLERVVDGDTAVMRIDGKSEYVRYIGIDTPEVNWDDLPESETCALRATEFNEDRLKDGKRIELEFDEELRDRYDRILAYVRVDGRLLNADILRQGLAETLTIPPNDRYAEDFSALERQARDRSPDSLPTC